LSVEQIQRDLAGIAEADDQSAADRITDRDCSVQSARAHDEPNWTIGALTAATVVVCHLMRGTGRA
jgi:hypothetical protein